MSQYLRPECIRDAVSRLVASRARAGFTDFLILKRALARANQDTVPFSSKDPEFTGAIQDLAATDRRSGASKGLPAPFVKVFGTAEARKYVGPKMLTNGTADTLAGSNWRRVVRIVGSDPRRGGLTSGHEKGLRSLLHKAGGEKPRLLDAAVWLHRGADVEPLPKNGGNGADDLNQSLETAFINALNLTKREISELFDAAPPSSTAATIDELLQDKPAEPREYLPDLDAPDMAEFFGGLSVSVSKLKLESQT